MFINSIKIEFTEKVKVIDLFGGIQGLSTVNQSLVKRSSICISEDLDDRFGKDNEQLSRFEKVYFPIFEDELTGIALGQSITANLDTSVHIRETKALINRALVRYFRSLGLPCGKTFVGRVEVYDKVGDDKEYKYYQRYILNPKYHDQYQGWQLDIAQCSMSRVLKKQLSSINTTVDSFFVMAGNVVIQRNKLPQNLRKTQNGVVYPILNKELEKEQRITGQYRMDKDKYVTKKNGIESFVNRYLNTQQFVDSTKIKVVDGGAFIKIDSENLCQVDSAARVLLFGNCRENLSPKKGLLEGGPYRVPEKVPVFFFIGKKGDLSDAKRLYNIFKNGVNSVELDNQMEAQMERLSDYLNHDVDFESQLSFFYSDKSTAINEIEEYLKSQKFDFAGKCYFALVLMDGSSKEKSPSADDFYIKIKELLLKYQIGSQCFYKGNVASDRFKFFLPNLASAIVQKEGGSPWSVKKLSTTNDMIVGIGASKKWGLKQPYLGSACCFHPDGMLHEFNICKADDSNSLQSQLHKAIVDFHRSFDKPERIIIHYYKKSLNKTESKAIEKMLHSLNINCPVYVVNVVTAVNDDLVAFDECESDLMPISGTYVKLRKGEYLLYNNERYQINFSASSKPYPIKLSITGGGSESKRISDEIICRDLITQVYQFCRLYAKSVTMQNLPITIAYPELVAEIVPCFTNGVIPSWGKNNVWMI